MASLNSRSDSSESPRSESKTIGLAGAAMIATLASLAGTQQAQAQEAPPAGPAWDCEWLDDDDGPGGKAPNAVKTDAPHADVGPAAVVEEESDGEHTTVRVDHGTTLTMRAICRTYPNLDQLRGLVGRILINGKPIPAADQAKITITMEGKYPVIYIPFLAVDTQWTAYETDFNVKEGNVKRLMSDYERAVRKGKAQDAIRLKGEIKTTLGDLGKIFELMKAYVQSSKPHISSLTIDVPTADGNFMRARLVLQTRPSESMLRKFYERAKSLIEAFKSKFGGPVPEQSEQTPEEPTEGTRRGVRSLLAGSGRVKGSYWMSLKDGVTTDEGKLRHAEAGAEAYLPVVHWKTGNAGFVVIGGGGGKATTAPETHSPGPYLTLRGGVRVEQAVSGRIYVYVTVFAGADFSIENEEYQGVDGEGRPVTVKVNSEVRPAVGGGAGIGIIITDDISIELGPQVHCGRPTAQSQAGMECNGGLGAGLTVRF